MGRPRQHGEQTRDRLVAAAGRLLAEEGPGALSIRRLANEVGTTTRAVYSLFGSKEGLISAMYWQMADTLARLHEAIDREPDPLAELLPLALAYRESARAHPYLYPLIFGNAVPGFRPQPEAFAHARRGFARVLDAIERAVAQGHFGGRTPDAVGHELWALVHGLACLELGGLLGDPEQSEARWRDAVPALLRGFAQETDLP